MEDKAKKNEYIGEKNAPQNMILKSNPRAFCALCSRGTI